jgi:hypothetical protein
MAISNGYLTLDDYQLYAKADNSDAGDDAVIEDVIEAASRFIDGKTERTFYARSETHYFDATPEDNVLWFDDDLISVTTLTNGDGTAIASTKYVLLPNNKTPKYGLKLLASSGISWLLTTAGDREKAITLTGSWGFAATAPHDIRFACYLIASNLYKRRFGQGNASDETITTASGLVITPRDVPAAAADILRRYARYV